MYMEVKHFVEKHKILTPIIFWGALVLIVLFFMALRDTKPDLNYPDDGGLIEYCNPDGSGC